MSKNRKNREIFNKEPQIYAKPHPSEQHYDPAIETNSFKAKAAPLRRKSPTSSKGTVQYTIDADMQFDQNAQSLVKSSLGQDVVQESRTTGFYKGKSDFSPSGVTSGLSERELMQPSAD